MKKILFLLIIIILTVGCSNSQQQPSKKESQIDTETPKNILQIEDVEGYWECKSSEEGILLRLGWKNDIDIYYTDSSQENSVYNVVNATKNSIEIQIKNNDKTTNAVITSNDNGETITLTKHEKEYYFIRIPKNEFYIKLEKSSCI
ncbi:hypothetical protein [Terrisporobacter sp.]